MVDDTEVLKRRTREKKKEKKIKRKKEGKEKLIRQRRMRVETIPKSHSLCPYTRTVDENVGGGGCRRTNGEERVRKASA